MNVVQPPMTSSKVCMARERSVVPVGKRSRSAVKERVWTRL